jgi:glycosyltransferase involved in cell wall biosynthesis
VSKVTLVTVLLAVHDGERYLRTALASILGQTISELELIVVDDASTDGSRELLAGIDDPRVRVLRNDRQRGLAASLNAGLDVSQGRYVARMDADDVAMPNRLERQLTVLRAAPQTAIIGTGALELDGRDRVGARHTMPAGGVAVRWAALFSSPFLHPTVLLDREVLERNGLRYDESFAESEDHDLWSRLLDVADGDNLADPLVLYRVHAGQASQRRRELQRECQLRVARRAIADVAPGLSPVEVDLAWRIGAGEPLAAAELDAALSAYLALVKAFERHFGRGARAHAARALARVALRSDGVAAARIAGQALRLDPMLPVRRLRSRDGRDRAATARRYAESWLGQLGDDETPPPTRIAAVFPEPTPYRAPLLDRIAALSEVDLTVIYASETVAARTWRIESAHKAVYLRGIRLPGAGRVVRHEYPLTPGVVRAVAEARPDVVVVSGWSTFAAQAAIAWCRVKGVPYVLVVESHDEGPRPGWRRLVKGAVVPSVVSGASGVLVTGTLARDSMVARGAAAEHVRVFANTVDVDEFGRRADGLAGRRADLRRQLGLEPDDVAVLCVARLGPEKRLGDLVRAVAAADDPRLVLVLAGDGPERPVVEKLAEERGARLLLLGDVDWSRIVELYVAADVFALLSERETWAVVVNEAAACGLPLVLSDRVGAAHDLLRDGENGTLVAAGDVVAAAAALRELAADPELRRTQGARSRELARDWGYGPSVDGFLEAVREAVADRS